MLSLRQTVAVTVILTTGITGFWLSSEKLTATPKSATNSPPAARFSSVATVADTSSPTETIVNAQDCCGGAILLAASPADVAAQTEFREKRAHVLAEFDNWAERYARATPEQRTEMLTEGVKLARERRAFMTDLIKTDPREAIAAADELSPLARKDLPHQVAENVEQMVSAKGDLEVLGVTTAEGNKYRRIAHIGNESFSAFTYGKRLAPLPEQNTPLIGVSLPSTESVDINGQTVERNENLLALREDKFRVLTKAEVALTRQNEPAAVTHHCPISGDETNVNGDETGLDVGGEIVWLCKNGHVAPYVHDATGQLVAANNAEIPKAFAGGPGEGAGWFPSTPAGWNTGSKRLIAMPIRFPEQSSNPFGTTDLNGAVSQSCTRFNQWSYGRVSFTYTLTSILTLPHSQAEYQSGALGGAEDAMMADAITLANNGGYNASSANFRTILFTGSLGNYCGLGQIVGPHSWVKCIDAPTITHEVGHNLGLPHANSWTPTTANPIGAGSHCEYCGTYNTMGQGGAAYDTMMRFYIRWLTYGEAVDVNANGTYRIYDPELTSLIGGRKHTLRIAKQGGQYYFVEFRPRATALSGNGSVDTTTQNGVRILRTDGSEQLDVTPGSANGMWDAAVTVGQSFTDQAAGITITPAAKGGSGTDQYMDVTVTYNAPALYSGAVFELQPQCAPGLCLDVNGAQDANGANVQIWAGNGGTAQQWRLEDQGSGQWELIPLCATSRRLDVSGAGSANGTNVQIWQDFTNTAQHWSLTNAGNGYFELTPQCATGSRLDVNGSGNTNGTNVQIYQANSSGAQRWRLLATGPQNGAIYSLEPQCAPGKRLDVSNSQDANGANVQIWTSNNSPAQQWKLEDEGNGLWELIPQCATTRRLDVSGGGTTNGTNIQLWQDLSNANQRWSIVSAGNGYYELIPQNASGSRADVNGAGSADGTNVQLWQSNSSGAQRWRLYQP